VTEASVNTGELPLDTLAQGKRATMEDSYDAKISKVDDQMVGLFGVF